MKILNLKVIAIAFMAIFCMAPICAVEMNRDGGSNSENYMVESKDVEKDTTQQIWKLYTIIVLHWMSISTGGGGNY